MTRPTLRLVRTGIAGRTQPILRETSAARARVLAVMLLAAGALAGLGAAVRSVPQTHYPTITVAAVVLVGTGLALLVLAEQCGNAAVQVGLAVFSTMIAAMVAAAGNSTEVVSIGPGVIAAALYAGHFLHTGPFWAHTGWSVAGYLLAAQLSHQPPPVDALANVAISALIIAAVMRRITGHLRHRGDYDSLTGLTSRSAWMALAEQAMSAAGSGTLSVALIDMDHFKTVNDTRGHHAGDELLRSVAEAWSRSLGSDGTVGRYGGDEFVVLLHGLDEQAARLRLQHLAAAHEATWSVGVAQHVPGESVTGLLHRADLDLLAAKRARGDRRAG